MSDYLANLAARNIAGTGLLRPRVAGIYDPPSLTAKAGFGGLGRQEESSGESTERTNFDPSPDGGLGVFSRGADEDRRKCSPAIPSSVIPAPELLGNKVGASDRDVPSILEPPLHPRNDRESSAPAAPEELSRAKDMPLATPRTFDLVTFFQKARAEAKEHKAPGSKDSAVANAKDQRGPALREVRSSEIRNTLEHHFLPGSAESSPFSFQPPTSRDPRPAERPEPTWSMSRNNSTDSSPQTQRPHATDREETAQEAAGEATCGEASRSKIAPEVHEGVRPARFHEPLARAEIANRQGEATELAIPTLASAKSQHPRFEAIWRQPRAPVNSPLQMEHVLRPEQREAQGQVVAASNPTVQVTIGRIEVRASVPHLGGPAREHGKPRVMGLDEYLGRRAGRSGK